MSFDIPIADQMRIALNYVKFKTRQKRLRTTDKVIADTVYGKVKGVKWQTVYGGCYYSFEGIPFAKPPVGRLRFKAPEEPDPWTDVKRCTRERSKPCQMNIILKQVQGREDCLYLNVYTKNINPDKPMPVLVWIYGGGFQMGEASRDLYSPDYFMLENVMLVTISYRLGPLGFLSLNDEELDVPGNAGLKDQVLALKWVKRNCQYFGGDQNNITVFGESAGGCSTHYMMLTEQTRDLFHKAVIMSGSAIAPWANIPQLNWAYRLAKATGYRGENNDSDVLEHLRHCKVSTLYKVSDDLLTLEERHQRLTFSFGPTIEPYASKQCVIPTIPLEMMRSCWGNNIPMLIGGNSSEGLLMFTEARKYPDLLHKLGDCEYMTPNDANLTADKRKEYGQVLRKVYFGEKEPSWKTILMYSDLCSYKYFWHGIQRTVLSRLHHATAPTYLYRFDFDSKHFNFMRIITCGRKVRGTCHADDLSYLFYNAGAKKLKHRTAEYKTIRRMISILVQFAECGNPNIPSATMAANISVTPTPTPPPPAPTAIATETEVVAAPPQELTVAVKASAAVAAAAAAAAATINGDATTENGSDSNSNCSIGDGGGSGNSQSSNTSNDSSSCSDETDGVTADVAATIQVDPWLPLSKDDKVFKCLNISDELEVIDLPETDKLKLWDSMYEHTELLY